MLQSDNNCHLNARSSAARSPAANDAASCNMRMSIQRGFLLTMRWHVRKGKDCSAARDAATAWVVRRKRHAHVCRVLLMITMPWGGCEAEAAQLSGGGSGGAAFSAVLL